MLALDLFVNLTHRSWVCLTVRNGVLSLDIFEIKKLTEQRSHVSSCVSLISGARCWLVDDSKAEWKQRDSGDLVDFFITLVSYSRLCLKWRSRQKRKKHEKKANLMWSGEFVRKWINRNWQWDDAAETLRLSFSCRRIFCWKTILLSKSLEPVATRGKKSVNSNSKLWDAVATKTYRCVQEMCIVYNNQGNVTQITEHQSLATDTVHCRVSVMSDRDSRPRDETDASCVGVLKVL